jgi:hypothetical protein
MLSSWTHDLFEVLSSALSGRIGQMYFKILRLWILKIERPIKAGARSLPASQLTLLTRDWARPIQRQVLALCQLVLFWVSAKPPAPLWSGWPVAGLWRGRGLEADFQLGVFFGFLCAFAGGGGGVGGAPLGENLGLRRRLFGVWCRCRWAPI